MKTSIFRYLLLGAALTTLALVSACSQQSSGAQAQPAPTQVVSAPPVPVASAIPLVPPAPEIPPAVAKPAIVPTNIVPTSPLAQVVRLAQGGVDESLIMVYITNSSRTFNLDADKIVYLTDLGLPTDVVTAMMMRDQQLQQEFAAAQAEQQAQQAQQTQQAQTAPAPEPVPADTAETVTPPAPVTADYFNDTLSPYGSWVVINGYGNCWRPSVCAYNPGWRPYCDRGHWVYTDCGWYWSSDYAWGSTFHYGRWFCDANAGWCWYPGTVWAPSWVTWRYSNAYCGWAPLPPYTTCQTGVGIVYQGNGINVGFSFGLGASCFTFVPTPYFCNPHPHNYCASPSQAAQIYNNTTVINDIHIHGKGNNQIIINNGIPAQSIANTTHAPIHQTPVHQIDSGFVHDSSGQPMDRPSRIDHLNSAGSASPAARPLVPGHPGSIVSTAGQNSPRSTGMVENGGSQPANNQIAQTGQGRLGSTSARTQPERSRPVATAPQRQAPSANYRSPAYNVPSQTPSANVNSSPQPVSARWQQSGTPRNYTPTSQPRQNFAAQNQVVAPRVNYSAPAQAQAQPHVYSQPRIEAHQNYSAPSVVSAPQPQRSMPSVASASVPQSQGGGRMGGQYWGR